MILSTRCEQSLSLVPKPADEIGGRLRRSKARRLSRPSLHRVDVAGRRVMRREDVEWCLDWIARFESLARDHGSFANDSQLQSLVDHLDEARRVFDERLTASDCLGSSHGRSYRNVGGTP